MAMFTQTAAKPYIIALEEHFTNPDIGAAAGSGGTSQRRARDAFDAVQVRLHDLGDLRLREMDEAGIDLQVIAHAPPPIQQMEPADAVPAAIATNDKLHDAVDRHPERFAGFAVLPTPDPEAAVAELDRTVTKLGFKGAMIHGRSRGLFHDDQRFWPIFERAVALDVPIYIHPGPPHPDVVKAYWGDYLEAHPGLSSAAWGYTVETANQALRLILSGLFDKYPDLKIILGHLGEGIPFLVDRIDEALKRPGGKGISFKEVFCRNFYVTTSGFFSTPALLCTVLEMGIDHVMFSVDWPFVANGPGTKWLETVPLSPADKEKLANGNARKLLKL